MTPLFRAQLKEKLAPLLRAAGFSGSGVTFRRLSGEVIHVLHVQGSKGGDSCCVELGIHLTFLPTALGQPPDPKKITEPHCEGRRRLAPHGQSDCWWAYGRDEREAARSADGLVDLVRRGALPHFDRFATFPASFDSITPQALAARDFSGLPGDMTASRAALMMARIAAHVGHAERAREFADIGLASLGAHAAIIRHELVALAGDGGAD